MLPKKHRHRATIQGTSHRNIHTSLSRSTSSINVTSPIILSININSPTTLSISISISISISSIQHRLLPIQLEMKGTNNTGKEVAITSRHSLKGMVMNKAIVNIANIESIMARSIDMVMSINTSMNMDMGTVMVVTMTN